MKQKDITKLYKNLKPNNEVAKSFDFHYNTPKIINKQQTYFIRKINEKESSDKAINKEIENYFNKPENYFDVESPIRVGKRSEIKDISLDIRSNKRRFSKKNVLNSSSISKQKFGNTRISVEKNANSLLDNNKFELIDNNRLDTIFNSFKELINSKKNKSYFKYNNLPENISTPLNLQQKKMLYQKRNNYNNKNILHYISKKIHKNEKDLLMNKVDNFLYKKEIINKIDNNSSLDESKDRFKWTTSLRNTDKFKGVRRTLVNINTDKYPFWSFLVEKSPNYQQTSLKPGIDLKNRNLVNFLERAKTISDVDENNFNSVKNLDDISVIGKNLFNLEYNREMSSKKKKILHKAFVENGKIVLNTDINKVFGKETFYKNYDENSSYLQPPNSSENRKGAYNLTNN